MRGCPDARLHVLLGGAGACRGPRAKLSQRLVEGAHERRMGWCRGGCPGGASQGNRTLPGRTGQGMSTRERSPAPRLRGTAAHGGVGCRGQASRPLEAALRNVAGASTSAPVRRGREVFLGKLAAAGAKSSATTVFGKLAARPASARNGVKGAAAVEHQFALPPPGCSSQRSRLVAMDERCRPRACFAQAEGRGLEVTMPAPAPWRPRRRRIRVGQ
jgi:hypothetical protein